MTRRDMLSAVALGALTIAAPASTRDDAKPGSRRNAGRLKQSASRWCYRQIPLPDLCSAAKGIGLSGIDLLQPSDWGVVRDLGLTCSMGYANDRRGFIANGITNPANHPMPV